MKFKEYLNEDIKSERKRGREAIKKMKPMLKDLSISMDYISSPYNIDELEPGDMDIDATLAYIRVIKDIKILTDFYKRN